MARPNPIVAGSVVLFLLAVGVGLFVLRRSERASPVEEHPDRRISERQAEPRPARLALPPPPRLAAGDELPAQPDAGLPLPRTEVEMLRQRQRLLADNFEPARQQADEQAFVRLGISEDKRAKIRAINERVARKVQSALAALRNGPVQKPLTAPGENVGQERRDALKQILGEATAAAFQKFERNEIRRLQLRFIGPWDAEMDKLTFPTPTPP